MAMWRPEISWHDPPLISSRIHQTPCIIRNKQRNLLTVDNVIEAEGTTLAANIRCSILHSTQLFYHRPCMPIDTVYLGILPYTYDLETKGVHIWNGKVHHYHQHLGHLHTVPVYGMSAPTKHSLNMPLPYIVLLYNSRHQVWRVTKYSLSDTRHLPLALYGTTASSKMALSLAPFTCLGLLYLTDFISPCSASSGSYLHGGNPSNLRRTIQQCSSGSRGLRQPVQPD